MGRFFSLPRPSTDALTKRTLRPGAGRFRCWPHPGSCERHLLRAAFASRRGFSDGGPPRESHEKRAAAAGTGAGGADRSAVLADDPMADRKSKARSLSVLLTREERLEHVLQHFGGHPAAVIAEFQLHVVGLLDER